MALCVATSGEGRWRGKVAGHLCEGTRATWILEYRTEPCLVLRQEVNESLVDGALNCLILRTSTCQPHSAVSSNQRVGFDEVLNWYWTTIIDNIFCYTTVKLLMEPLLLGLVSMNQPGPHWKLLKNYKNNL